MSRANLSLHAAGSVAVQATGAPTWVWQNGAFTNVITDTGVGIHGLNLQADKAIDAAECAVILSRRGAVTAWPNGVNQCCIHTSDVIKEVRTVQEDSGGGGAGADAADDTDFDIAIVKFHVL